MKRHPPSATLFPYTTLFRSHSIRGFQITLKPCRSKTGPRITHLVLLACLNCSSLTNFSTWMSNASSRGGLKRSEEHTSELQSRLHLVCRLLLEKKQKTKPEV